MTTDTRYLRPAARLHGLVMTETADATLVYDQDAHQIHQLNQPCVTIWQLCDGQRSVDDLVVSTGYRREIVLQALGQLAHARLLERELPADLQLDRPTRRTFLKRSVAAGVAIPAIVSITAPSAAIAGSLPGDCGKSCQNNGDCNNCCSQCNTRSGPTSECTSASLGVCVHPELCLDVEALGQSCNRP